MVLALLLVRSVPETLLNLPFDPHLLRQTAGACLVRAVVPSQHPRRMAGIDQVDEFIPRFLAFLSPPFWQQAEVPKYQLRPVSFHRVVPVDVVAVVAR